MGAFPAPPEEAAGPLSAVPLECLGDIMAYLAVKRDLFAFARTCRRATRALGLRPLNGLPVLFVSRVTLRADTYYIEYRGLAEIDAVPAARKRDRPQPPPRAHRLGQAYGDAATFARRRLSHFVVVYTYDHPFLLVWCGPLRHLSPGAVQE